jgi:hypothetical protein
MYSIKTVTVMAVLLSGLICMLLSSFLVLGAEPQAPLMIPIGDGSKKVDLIYEYAILVLQPRSQSANKTSRLKKAEIIPTVLDSFLPLLAVSVEWEYVIHYLHYV